jgi:DNA-binding NtrC family response regulator
MQKTRITKNSCKMNQILVLTQETEISLEIERNLKTLGSLKIYTFSNSLELINHYLTNYASLIILDCDILKNDILPLIQSLQSINQNAKIIILLSQAQMKVCSSVLSLGILSYQIKPVNITNIVEIITSVLKTSTPK